MWGKAGKSTDLMPEQKRRRQNHSAKKKKGNSVSTGWTIGLVKGGKGIGQKTRLVVKNWFGWEKV